MLSSATSPKKNTCPNASVPNKEFTVTNFWQKPLKNLTADEWEKICCRCGRCCLIKLQNDDNDEVFYTRIICRYFDTAKHLCREYSNRCRLVPSCLKVTPQNIDSLTWMPQTCAYRILNETGDLPPWHPLKGGQGFLPLPENLVTDISVAEEDMEDYIIEDKDL